MICVLYVTSSSLIKISGTGQETLLNLCLILALLRFSQVECQQNSLLKWQYLSVGLISCIAVMNSAGALFPVASIFIATTICKTQKRSYGDRVLLSLSFVLPLVGWMLWKQWYYGHLLPISMTSTFDNLHMGMQIGYLRSFLVSNGLALPACASILLCGSAHLRRNWSFVLGCSLAFGTMVQVLIAGGDHVAFRSLLPLSLAMLLLAAAGLVHLTKFSARYALVSIALFLNFTLPSLDDRATELGIESIKKGQSQIFAWNSDWRTVGTALQNFFGTNSGVVVATTAAGTLSYHSDLRVIDMRGRNQRYVDQSAVRLLDRAGSLKIATLKQMQDSGVHLLIGQPTLIDGKMDHPRLHFQDFEDFSKELWLENFVPVGTDANLKNLQLVEFPVVRGRSLLAVWLKYHPAVQHLITNNQVRAFPISFRPDAQGFARRLGKPLLMPKGWQNENAGMADIARQLAHSGEATRLMMQGVSGNIDADTSQRWLEFWHRQRPSLVSQINIEGLGAADMMSKIRP